MHRATSIVLLSLLTVPAVADDTTLRPGLYEVTTKSSMDGVARSRICIEAKDVVAGLDPETTANCKRDRGVLAGGKLDVATTCPDRTIALTGSYTPTGFALDSKVVMKGNGDSDPMTILSHREGKRVAEQCKRG